jgi:uncharacterized protein YqcC (DUF446 family)
MSDPRTLALTRMLDDIEAELRSLGSWSGQPPDEQAFASSMPFFADQMRFEEWLQWVLVARFRALLDGDLPLPERCQIAPMAEEALLLPGQDVSRVLALLHQLDALFSDDQTF